MKKVLAAWKERDACIARGYGCGNEKNDNECSDCGGDFGKGLVVFLSSTSTVNTWSGECPCVNATVHWAVTSTPDGGLTFQGSRAWAEWPVGEQGQKQLYHFANYKFTLVATVSVPEVMEGIGSSFPLMGVRMNDHKSTPPFDLLWAKKNKWEIIFNGSRLALPADAKWELNTTHRVGLEMDYFKELLVYVDGLTVYDGGGEDYSFFEETKTNLGFHSVSHFYIGGDGKRDSGNIHVTVSNFLLYNRALYDDKLKALMKTKAVAASEARVPAPKGAPESSHASESSDEPANGSVAMDEARQYATSSSPQRQDSPAQPLGNKKGPAVSRQTFSPDVIGLTTPAAKGEMEEEAASSGGMAPALSPTPSAGSRQEVLEARKPFGGERPEGGQEPLPPNLAASTMGQAGKADEGSLRNGTEDDWTQHRISLYVLRSVHNEPANADTLTSEEQDADREEDTHVRTAVGTNSGPDLLNGTYATPADATTATPAFNRDQIIVHHKDNVSDDVGAALTPTSTAPGGTETPLESNAAPPLGNDIFDSENITELMSIGLVGESTVHGCVSRAFLLLLLGLCGVVAGS